MVDAATGTILDMDYQKFYEVAPYITRTDIKPQQTAFYMNNKRWESLTKEQQQAIIEALDEAGEYSTKILYESLGKSIKNMESKGAKFYEIDLTEIQKVMEKYLTELEAEGLIAPGLLERVHAL